MRTVPAQDSLLWTRQHLAVYLRIDAKDTGGTWRDLTARRGYNMVKQGTLTVNPDQPAASFTAKLKREVFNLSLAPYMAGSILNTLGSGTWLLGPSASVRAYIQLRPSGFPPDQTGHSGDDGNAGAWNIVFDGQIDAPDSGPDPMSISCSDWVTSLQRQWIKSERIYGVWQSARWTRANTVVVASANATNGANNIDATTGPWWQAQGDFTTGAAEPAWPASPTPGTTTVSDNGGTWKCVSGPTGTPADVHIQTLIDDNLGHTGSTGAMTLYVPTAMSPTTVVNPYVQKGMSLFQAIQNVCNINGWIVSWKFTTSQRKWDGTTDSSGSAFKLCFFDPVRSNVTSTFTVPRDHYKPVASFKQDLTNLRNDVDVVFYDRGNLDSSGNPTPTTVNSQQTTGPTAVLTIGDFYAQIAEGAASQITDSTTAQRLADACRLDLAQPPIDTQVVVPAAYWFEPTDVITLSANGVQFDQDQVLAVYSVQLDIADKAANLTLGLRQSPCSGVKRWQAILSGPGRNGGPIKQLNPHGVTAVGALASIRGARVSWAIPSAKQGSYRCTEVHVSAAGSGFIPSSSTLKGTSSSGYMLIGDLTPGTQYWVKLIHRDARDRAGPTSNSVTFTADQVQTADIANLAVTDAKINDVSTTKLTGTITQSQLESRLRQGFKRKSVTPTVSPGFVNGGDTPSIWDTVVQDNTSRSSAAGSFNPGATVFGEARWHLHIRGANIDMGAQAYAKCINGSTVIAVSAVAQAQNAPDGLYQAEFIIDFRVKFPWVQGSSYQVHIYCFDPSGTAITGCYLAAERGIATLSAVTRSLPVTLGQQFLDPTGANGHVYRVTTAGTTSSGAVTYGTTDYLAQTDGTAVLTEDGSNNPRAGTFFEFIPMPS